MKMYQDANGCRWTGHLTKNQIIEFFYNNLLKPDSSNELSAVDIDKWRSGSDYTEFHALNVTIAILSMKTPIRIALEEFQAATGTTEYMYAPLTNSIPQPVIIKFDEYCYGTLTAVEQEVLRIWNDFISQRKGRM